MSGDLDGTPQISLIGPAGAVTTDGLIIAARHIHMNPADAHRWGLSDGEAVTVAVRGTGRDIDFDEANAAATAGVAVGDLIEPGA